MTVEMRLAFPINFNGETACEDNVIMVKIDNTTTSRLVDSGAQSTVLGKKQFDNLVRDGLKAKLQPEERNLRVYGNGYLPVVGKFEASLQCYVRWPSSATAAHFKTNSVFNKNLLPL